MNKIMLIFAMLFFLLHQMIHNQIIIIQIEEDLMIVINLLNHQVTVHLENTGEIKEEEEYIKIYKIINHLIMKAVKSVNHNH